MSTEEVSSNEPPTFKHLLTSGLLFNLSWLAIVVGESAVLAALVVILHLWLHGRMVGLLPGESRFVLLVFALGFLTDQLLFFTGIFFDSTPGALSPFWLSCLWPVLATAIYHAFQPLWYRLPLGAAAGAVGAGFSYSAGVAMTNIEWGSPVTGPVVIGILWAIVFPSLLWFARESFERGVANEPA